MCAIIMLFIEARNHVERRTSRVVVGLGGLGIVVIVRAGIQESLRATKGNDTVKGLDAELSLQLEDMLRQELRRIPLAALRA
jgi:hypothetical protein